MVRVTVWLQLLLVVLILRQSAAVSDQCSQLQEEISRLERDIVSIRDLKHENELRAGNCDEKLRKQILISQATDRNLTQSEAVISGLKKQLEVKEEVLKSNDETQTQLQTDIGGLTKTVQSLNQIVQRLCDTPEYEQLKSETHVSEAAFRSMKLAEDEFKSNREQLEADINRLKKELVEQNIKRQQSEADINDLKKELDKHKINLQKSGAVNSGLKNELKAKEVLKTTIDDVTNKLKSLNQTVQRLFEEPQHVCRYVLEAAKSGDVNTVKILFKCSTDNCTNDDMYRDTPLTYAATYGHVEVVRVLLEGGANVERADAFRRTALHRAAWYGHLDVCRLLLDWGAKVDPLNKWKDTPLHWAAGEGHLSVVKLLVEREADVTKKNNYGQTASDLALSSGKKDVADWLDSVKRGKGPLTV